MNEGGANYYPVARESWYPNASHGLGNYATYHMRFHVPKGLQLIATGTKLNERRRQNHDIRMENGCTPGGRWLQPWHVRNERSHGGGKLGDNLTVDAYANTDSAR